LLVFEEKITKLIKASVATVEQKVGALDAVFKEKD